MAPGGRLVINSFRNANRRRSAHYVDGHHAHHLCPKECARSVPIARLLAEASVFGFNLHDFSLNGLLLPANEAAAKASGLPLHLGSHPRHSRLVIDQMLHIADQTARLGTRFKPKQSYLRLTAFVSVLRQSILAHANHGVVCTLDEIPLHGFTDEDIAQSIVEIIANRPTF
jgi:A nuclease family of the HNH/ENDO VII superfamily with conserved AHH